MAATDGSDLDIRLRLRDAAKFQRDAKRSGKSVRGVGKDADAAGKRARFATAAFGGLRGGLLGVGSAARTAGVALAAVSGIVAVKSVKAAVDLGEQTNKANVIFRSGAKDILAWSKSTDTALGLSQREALAAAAQFGGLFNQMDFGEKKSAKMSKRMVALSGDLASMFNSSPQEALEALQSGFAGETEALRKYNIFLSESTIAQEAARLGLKKKNGALTDAQKTQARYSLILKSTTVAHGDFERTSGSLANQWRILSAQVDNLSARVGSIFIPSLTKGAKFLTDEFVPALQLVGTDMESIFARKDIDLGDKLKLTGKSFSKHIGPFADELERRMKAADVQGKLDKGIAWIAPKIGEAFGKAAPKAISAFWNAFKGAGLGGQAITVGVLATKLGITGAVTRGVGGLLASGVRKGWGKSFGRNKLPVPGMGTGSAGVINIRAANVVVNKGTGPGGGTPVITPPGGGVPKPAPKGPWWKRLPGKVGRGVGGKAGAAAFGLSVGASLIPAGAISDLINGDPNADAGVINSWRRKHAPNLSKQNPFNAPMIGNWPGSGSLDRSLSALLNSGGGSLRPTLSSTPPGDRDIVVHNVTTLDGRVIAESVARHSQNKRARK